MPDRGRTCENIEDGRKGGRERRLNRKPLRTWFVNWIEEGDGIG